MQNYLQHKKVKETAKVCKAKEQALREEVEKQKSDIKARQEANKKKKEENAKKSEIVQQVRVFSLFQLQWESKNQTFKSQKHTKTRHFGGRFSNGLHLKWSGP